MKNGRITLVMLWVKSSGNITSVNDLVLRLDKERFNVIFIFLSGQPADKDPLKEKGYEVFYLKDSGWLEGFNFAVLSRLIKILKKCSPDIIHCHGHKATVYGSLASNFVKIPVVMAHVHGLDRSRYLRRKFANLFLFRKVHRILCVAESVRNDVLKNNWLLSPDKVSVLENSVEYERFADGTISKTDAKKILALPAESYVFGTIARFGPYKGHSFLISAIKIVKSKIPTAHLVLIGEGPLKEDVQHQIDTDGLAQFVHLFSQRNDIPNVLRAMDAFVLPSTGSEGMPRVLLEVMAADVPYITTTVGGNPEIINTPDIGFLVQPKDQDALAQAMTIVAQMPGEKLVTLTEKARQRVRQNYSHQVVSHKLGEIYEDELSRSRKKD